MKTKIFLFSCLLVVFISACKHKENPIKKDCIANMLTQKNMIPYGGGEINGCKFFVVLYEWKGEQYFSLGNPCADMIPNAVDCDGIEVTNPNFWNQATNLGIIGIEP